MSSVLDIIKAVAQKSRRHVVLAEGEDPRILEGGARAQADGLATITFLGDEAKISAALSASGYSADDFNIVDPTAVDVSAYAALYYDLRKHKGINERDAADAIRNPLNYAAMMVRNGAADGTVAGAVATTADTVRAAFQVIGKAKGAQAVSLSLIHI